MAQRLKDKDILLGVSGGIAAYKACELASRLVKEGAKVTAVLTPGAQKFVTPFAFEALTGRPCITELFQRIAPGENPYPHIEPAKTAELVIVAPATADCMAKLAHGLADDVLSTLMLSIRCPVVICPAMNVQMWEHPATQQNVKTLNGYGHLVMGPESGSLACGMTGAGRMSEPAQIAEFAVNILGNGIA
jgi:phosphopantothenoylcysteine decarboxylase / phosphopantothenate---cysteine ligase